MPVHASGLAYAEVGERVAAVVHGYVAAAHGSNVALLGQQQPLMEAGLDSLDLLKACAGHPCLKCVSDACPKCAAMALIRTGRSGPGGKPAGQ